MDWIEVKQKAVEFLKKYRYVLLIFLAGLLLMLLPEGEKQEEPMPVIVQQEKSQDLQTSLAKILSKIDGAGKVEVLLTEAVGPRTHFQMDEDISDGESTNDIRRETVVISDGSRSENGLIFQVDAPVYQGAVVLCQGADSAIVRLAIVEAVANATGLRSDKISVLKMKA